MFRMKNGISYRMWAAILWITNNYDKVNKLLKYSVSYADSETILPPVGIPADYINLANEEYLSQFEWWQKANSIWLNEGVNWHELFERDKSFIPHTFNREGYYGDKHFAYWLHGYQEYQKTLKALEPYGITKGRYFDFGGSTGRVFRHFAFQSEAWEVWSSDFKLSSVEWNLRYFPKSIKTFLNNSNPSLPLPDGYFDLVSAYSVFTHINEPETSWLAEIRRILRVGGIAYLTIHDEDTWKNQGKQLRDSIVKFRPDIANLPNLPNGKTVVTFREDDPYNCNVFHSREYIEVVWGRFFEICDMKPLYADRQTVVICRRRD
jgi:SAM-dependent methyltransferase